ncbi:hypothetical protein DFH11DRAFT_1602872 [Phellopilus nigrolimitatus]|nr:hypothetical protein DFH11DRAFT_1602872 [Phellopilus nigrolimitatus]
MWVIEGAFDGDSPGNLERKKFKVLKPGRSYPLGRKAKHPLQLVLSHPKISAEHVTFVVGEHTVDSVSDPSFRPTLTLQNLKSKTMQVSRGINGTKDRMSIDGMAEGELLPGDTIALVTGIYANVYWRPVCCYVSSKTSALPLDKCASLGVKIVSTCRPEITHHLTPTLSTTPAIATTLLVPAQLVRPDWLTELLHLSETAASASGHSMLEFDYRLPDEARHRPTFAPSLSAQLKTLAPWEPTIKRVELLKGWRFVFIGEKERELDSETRALVERGGGEYEAFDVSGGATRWRQVLARNKRKAEAESGKGLSVIGETDTLKVAAGDTWDSMLDVLKSSGLRIIGRIQLIEAVLCIDTSRIDSTLGADNDQESSLPDGVPNTHPEEFSSQLQPENITPPQELESAPRSRLRKRVSPASRGTTPSVVDVGSMPPPRGSAAAEDSSAREPVRASEEPEGTAGRKRPLVRRARTNAAPPLILGVGDPSIIDSQPPVLDSEPVVPAISAPATDKPPSSAPTVRSSRLKKRVRSEAPLNPILAGLEAEIAEATTQQPPLKRFKALFDETDPDRVASQTPGSAGFSGGIIDSQMFSQLPTETGGASGNGSGDRLNSVPEEVEGRQTAQAERADEVEDAPMVDADANELPPSSDKRQTKPPSTAHPVPFNSTQATQRTASKNRGAAPGKPDTDAAFLKALASTKKGKRREDDFDREFNNLRISKPEQEQEADDWGVLADFGDESNLMGNFMVIVEMDVPDKSETGSRITSRAQSKEPERAEWRGKPDFKKFKKKTSTGTRPSVELVLEDENDYGMGSVYWKGGSQSQSKSQGVAQSEPATLQRQEFLQPSQTQNRGFLQSGPSKPRSQSVAKTQAATRRSQSRQIVSEEEESEIKPRSAKGNQKGGKGKADTNGKGKSQPLFLNTLEEEDEEGDARKTGLDGPVDDDFDLNLDLDLDEDVSEDDPDPTLRSTARSTRSTAKSKSKPIPAREGAAAKRVPSTKKRSAALLDDDSDTGMTFKGFGGRKKARAK